MRRPFSQLDSQLALEIQELVRNGQDSRNKKEELWNRCIDAIEYQAAKFALNDTFQQEDYVSEGYLKFEYILPRFTQKNDVPFSGFLIICYINCLREIVRHIILERKMLQRMYCTLKHPPAADTKLLNQELFAVLEQVFSQILLSSANPQREKWIFAYKLHLFQHWTPKRICQFLKEKSDSYVYRMLKIVRRDFERTFARDFPEHFERFMCK